MKLVAEGLRKRLGGRWVLDGVTLACEPGEIVVVTGENGAGKSTLLQILAGAMQPDGGRVTLNGKDVGTRSGAARRALGYAAEQSLAIEQLGVSETIALVAALKRAPMPGDAVLARLGLLAFANAPLDSLSLGQRRRVTLTAALVGEPTVLILDEPSNGLDEEGIRVLQTIVREHVGLGRSAVIATHDLELARAVATRQLRLERGQLRAA